MPPASINSPERIASSALLIDSPVDTPVSTSSDGAESPSIDLPFLTHSLQAVRRYHFDLQMLSPTITPSSKGCPVVPAGIDELQGSDSTQKSHSSLAKRLAPVDLNMEEKWDLSKYDTYRERAKDVVPRAPDNDFYEIRKIPHVGYGCFALKSIKLGTRILSDSPLLVCPIAHYLHEDIEAAFKKLSEDEKVLYFSLHSAHRQNPTMWPRKVADVITGRERYRIEEQHYARLGKESSLVSIFQTNCMEKGRGATVFPNAARFNHRCNPNACFAWNPAIQKETIHAIHDIKAGEEITLSYCDIVHDKDTRRWELKHYGFVCDCIACDRDESDPDSFAVKSASRRYRVMELEQDTAGLRGKFLDTGARTPGFVEQLLEMAKLLIEEGDYTARMSSCYLDIALVCELHQDFRFAKIAAQKALQVRIDCQGSDFPDVKRYQDVVDRIASKQASNDSTEAV